MLMYLHKDGKIWSMDKWLFLVVCFLAVLPSLFILRDLTKSQNNDVALKILFRFCTQFLLL